MEELIYDGKDIEDIIRRKYPNAQIKDASDDIHTERFSFKCDVDELEFYKFAIDIGFIGACLKITLRIRQSDPNDKLLKELNDYIT